jgi:TPP-dependent pyruvate/acetoin dehydrogenase alpha subunit
MIERGLLDEAGLKRLEKEILAEIDQAQAEALAAPYPLAEEALVGVFEAGSVGDRAVRAWRWPGGQLSSLAKES